jgi:hypothetical protein
MVQEVRAEIWEAFVANYVLVPTGRLLLDITTHKVLGKMEYAKLCRFC